MRLTVALFILMASSLATARAAELNITITSNDQDTIVVEPGATVDYEVTGVLTDTDNEGLSYFLFDLAFDGGPLDAADNPPAMPLTNFTAPEGFTNPEGFGGAVIDGVVHQVGGSQNTLKSPLMSGSVITGLGHRPIVLATGSLTAPMTDGAYTLTASEVLGRVIEQGDDGSGEIWATEWAFEGEVTPLQLFVGPQCLSVADCADLDGDGIRDNPCLWWACNNGQCESIETTYGDMGSINGACEPDGATDMGDRIQALSCFTNTDPCSQAEYACEESPPIAFNGDIAGCLGDCHPDGYCDGNDAFQVVGIFIQQSACTCLGDPMPTYPPSAVQYAVVRLESARTIGPGGIVEVDAVLDNSVENFKGYQLHLEPRGGRSGQLNLVDIYVRGGRRNRSNAFYGTPFWSAFNVMTGQMVVGLDRGGVRGKPQTYLATFVYQASEDASGTFLVDARIGAPQGRTLFCSSDSGSVVIAASAQSTIIEVAEADHTPVRTASPHEEGIGEDVPRKSNEKPGSVRLFMSAEGQASEVSQEGYTEIMMPAGSTRRINVWLEDTSASQSLGAYQLIFETTASPLADAEGVVSYATTGEPGSILIDQGRPDWPFEDSIGVTPPLYEEEHAGVFGVIYLTAIPQDQVNPGIMGGIHYLAEFELAASSDALGDHLLYMSAMPPQTFLADFAGCEYHVDELQPLMIHAVSPCVSTEDCADVDDNGIRDDACLWWACNAGLCESTDIVFADMGGQFGACPPDGAADGNDRFLALTCFAGQGWQNGECEPDPPNATNLDAGGPFGSCDPDGVCDGNDAFAALNAFSGESSCTCPLDGAPMPEVEQPVVTGTATIELRPTRKQLRPGETIAIEAYLTTPLDDLRGYQLHLGSAGGTRGHLDLVDISIDRRHDAVFADLAPWAAFNVGTQQMVAGLDTAGVRTKSRAYLATFTYRASRDAAGPFRVELLADVTDAAQRTFVFRTDARAVTELKVESVVVDVVGGRRGGVR